MATNGVGHVVDEYLRSGDDIPLVTPVTTAAASEKEPVTVLVVDDEIGIAEVTAEFLERAKDQFEVVVETSATSGLERLGAESFDGIVSDYQMPGMNGIEFLREVRQEDSELPFILFTGRGSEEVAGEAIEAGVTDYMQKGSGTEQYEVLANRVENAIDRYRMARELWTALRWYQRLVEQDLAGMYLVQDETYIYVNRRFAEIFGYDQAGLVGASVFTVVADEDKDMVRENLRRRVAGELESLRYSFTGERRDGSQLEIEVHGGTIEFEGHPAIIGILLDSPG